MKLTFEATHKAPHKAKSAHKGARRACPSMAHLRTHAQVRCFRQQRLLLMPCNSTCIALPCNTACALALVQAYPHTSMPRHACAILHVDACFGADLLLDDQKANINPPLRAINIILRQEPQVRRFGEKNT